MQFLKLYFSKINYERTSVVEPENMEPNFERDAKYFVNSDNKNIFKIVINQKVNVDDFYKANVELTGIIEFDYKNEEEKVMKLRNAFAIMIPYIRSELTLITSQPGITPVMMPLIQLKKIDKDINMDNIFDSFVDDSN